MLFITTLLASVAIANAARILGIGVVPSHSHQLVFEPIWRELSLKGHEVVLMTPNPLKDPTLTNLTEIDWSFSYEFKKKLNLDELLTGKISALEVALRYRRYGIELTRAHLDHPKVQRLIEDEDEHFDLVMVEVMTASHLAFGHRFNCPVIGLLSYESPTGMYENLGNPLQAPLMQYSMGGFKKRFMRFVLHYALKIFEEPFTNMAWDGIVREKFGDNYPSTAEMVANIDMLFMNANPAFSIVKPLVPGIIHFGSGIHIKPPKPLPKDINSFLDDSKHGALYFSLGSNVVSSVITAEMREVFFKTFEKLPYNVLMKFEESNVTLPENVMLVDWAPQQDVLSHKSIRGFVTQCGMQSLEEALYSHTPVICIPFFGDQPRNADNVERQGLGLQLNKDTLTKEGFTEAIMAVMTNPKYRERSVELARISMDQPMSGLEKVIWWTEYVIRNKGAKPLRSSLIDMPWYQYYAVDVIGVLSSAICMVLFILYRSVNLFLRLGSAIFIRKIKSD